MPGALMNVDFSSSWNFAIREKQTLFLIFKRFSARFVFETLPNPNSHSKNFKFQSDIYMKIRIYLYVVKPGRSDEVSFLRNCKYTSYFIIIITD